MVKPKVKGWGISIYNEVTENWGNKFNTSQSVWNRSLANLNSKSYFSTGKFVLSWPDTNSLSLTCCTKNLA